MTCISGEIPLLETGDGTVPVVQDTGIAALAARGRQLDARNCTTYTELPTRSVLNRAISRRSLPFKWTLNPYRGCEVGCVYCYARYTHEFLGFEDPQDFERRIYVKEEVGETLERDLQLKHPEADEPIAIGTATDPYQPAERRFERTRQMLQVLARHRGLSISVTTKQELILRDIDMLNRIRERNRLTVNVSLITPDHRKARQLDPRASTPQARLKVLEHLSQAGIPTTLFLMPIIPGITDDANELEILIKEASEAGTEQMAHQVLFLRSCIRKRFYPFLAEHSDRLFRAYRQAYSRDGEAPEEYRKRIDSVIREFAEKYGINRSRTNGTCDSPEQQHWSQGDLFEGIASPHVAA